MLTRASISRNCLARSLPPRGPCAGPRNRAAQSVGPALAAQAAHVTSLLHLRHPRHLIVFGSASSMPSERDRSRQTPRLIYGAPDFSKPGPSGQRPLLSTSAITQCSEPPKSPSRLGRPVALDSFEAAPASVRFGWSTGTIKLKDCLSSFRSTTTKGFGRPDVVHRSCKRRRSWRPV